MRRDRFVVAILCMFGGALVLSGCVTSSETAERNQLTKDVGVYPPGPVGAYRPRVGIPPIGASGENLEGSKVEALAADQLSTLAVRTDRFVVIERTQLQKLLDEQGLEGIVREGELARPANVRGVDYLFLGKVTNLRVKAERASRGFGLASIPVPGAGNLGAFDYKNKSSKITTECGVDLRLVDPSTGEVLEAEFSDFKRTDTIGAIGIQILGANAEADADLQIDEDNKGLILRLALDDTIKKMLTRLDTKLMRLKPPAPEPAPAPAPAAETAPAPAPAPAATAPAGEGGAEAKFCSGCGAKLEAGAKFCGGCGAKVST